jgi:preprotein translocase subunit SecG
MISTQAIAFFGLGICIGLFLGMVITLSLLDKKKKDANLKQGVKDEN